MRRISLAIGQGLLVLALAACSYLPNKGETLVYKGDLNGVSEVPPRGAPGVGKVEVSFQTRTKIFHWKITYTGLTGPATAAHFHGPAPIGTNAGVVVALTPPFDSPIEGETVITDDQAAQLAAGNWYFNIHTAANPNGELRGQLKRVHFDPN